MNFVQDTDYKYIILNNKKFKLFEINKKCIETVNSMCEILQELAKGNFDEIRDFEFKNPILYLESQLNHTNTVVLLPEENAFKFNVGFIKRAYIKFNLNNQTFTFKGIEYSFNDFEGIELDWFNTAEINILFKIKGLKKSLKYKIFNDEGMEEKYQIYAKKMCDALNQVIKGNYVKVDNEFDNYVYVDETLTDDKKQALSFLLPITRGEFTNLNYVTSSDFRKLMGKLASMEVGNDVKSKENHLEKIKEIDINFFKDEELEQSDEFLIYVITLFMRLDKFRFIVQNISEESFWENMMKYTKYIKENNNSYEEFAAKILKGRKDYFELYCPNEYLQEDQEDLGSFIDDLLISPNSVWNTIKFN